MFNYFHTGRIGNSKDKATRKAIKTVMAYCYIGDWFVLYQISKNVNMYFFRAFMRELQNEVKSKSGNKLQLKHFENNQTNEIKTQSSLPGYQSAVENDNNMKSLVASYKCCL